MQNPSLIAQDVRRRSLKKTNLLRVVVSEQLNLRASSSAKDCISNAKLPQVGDEKP